MTAALTVGRGSRCLRNGLPRLAFLAVHHLLVGSRPLSTERSDRRGRYRLRCHGRGRLATVSDGCPCGEHDASRYWDKMIGAAFDATLADAQAGDETAFACLFRDIQPALLRYLHVIGRDVADDAASETWLQAVAGLRNFSGNEQSFRAWLFAIARHRVIDYGRARTRRPTVPLAASGADEPLAPDAADVAIERISAQAVLSLIATLPRDQAEIIVLRVVAGLDTDAVARLVGKSPGAVRVAAHRGLRRLAAVIDRPGVMP